MSKHRDVYFSAVAYGAGGAFIATGEIRCPKAGEWYLSKGIPEAYRAYVDLSTAYQILRQVPTAPCLCCAGRGWVPVLPEKKERVTCTRT